MKHLFIVNPTAGRHDCTKKVHNAVKEVFTKAEDYEIYVTAERGDGTRKVLEAAASGEEIRIYACGGDGTFNEIVCGAAHKDNAAVCPIPTGTGNDFARMFGEESKLFNDIRALVNGKTHPIDLINCNGSYSANICSVGIDARIGGNVHKYSSLPLIGGAGGYVISSIVEMFRGISIPMRISAPGTEIEGEKTLVCVCNGRFYGGGFNPSRKAMPDDGILDIFIVKKLSLFTFARLIGRYAAGHAEEMKDEILHITGDRIKISFDEDSVVNIDGEIIRTKECEMKLEPKALNLTVPEGMKFFG